MTFTRFTALIFTILFTINLPGCSDPQQKIEKHYKRALEYIKIDDERAAIIELKNAIQLDAKYADARYHLGLLYLKAGNPKAAFDELQRAFSLDPQNLDAGVKVAEFHLISRNKEESRRYIRQVLKVDPNYLDGLALLANIELIEGNFSRAEEAIDKALIQAPEMDKFYIIKGNALVAQNKWEEGEKIFQKAIKLGPDNFANYRALLIFYQQRKNDAAAQNLLDKMILKFPDNPRMYLILAEFHQRKGNTEKAENAMLKMVEIQPDSIPFRLMLTDFYKKQLQFDKAEETLKSALSDFNNSIQLQVALAELSFDLKKFDQSQAIIEKLLATNPANGGANLIKARFLIKDGENNEALNIINPLTTDYPRWPEPYYYSALTHLRLGQVELAQQSIEQALQNDINNDRYHALASQIHLTRGNSAEAGREATLALRINGRSSIAVKLLAKSLIQAKEYDKAIDFIGKLNQEVVAKDVELLGSLGLAYIGQKDPEQAKQIFSDLLILAPDNSKALALLTALTAEKDIPKAISFVQQHLAKSETAGHYILLGDLLTRNEQFEEALKAYQKVQELAPENPQGYILSARLLSRLDKVDETIAKYEELLKNTPNSIAGIMGLATTYEIQGRKDEAKSKYIEALEIQPDLPAAANNLAWMLASEEQPDLGEALRLAMQAKQAFPDQPNIADTLGWVHYKRKAYSLAISQFNQALEGLQDNPVIQYHLSLALHGNGDIQAAIDSLEKALASENPFEERSEAETLLNEWKKETAGLSQ